MRLEGLPLWNSRNNIYEILMSVSTIFQEKSPRYFAEMAVLVKCFFFDSRFFKVWMVCRNHLRLTKLCQRRTNRGTLRVTSTFGWNPSDQHIHQCKKYPKQLKKGSVTWDHLEIPSAVILLEFYEYSFKEVKILTKKLNESPTAKTYGNFFGYISDKWREYKKNDLLKKKMKTFSEEYLVVLWPFWILKKNKYIGEIPKEVQREFLPDFEK